MSLAVASEDVKGEGGVTEEVPPNAQGTAEGVPEPPAQQPEQKVAARESLAGSYGSREAIVAKQTPVPQIGEAGPLVVSEKEMRATSPLEVGPRVALKRLLVCFVLLVLLSISRTRHFLWRGDGSHPAFQSQRKRKLYAAAFREIVTLLNVRLGRDAGAKVHRCLY